MRRFVRCSLYCALESPQSHSFFASLLNPHSYLPV
jgi:hypothetical protein